MTVLSCRMILTNYYLGDPWTKTWQMQFNVTKSHTMRISRNKEPVLMDYYIDGQKLLKNHPVVLFLAWFNHQAARQG